MKLPGFNLRMLAAVSLFAVSALIVACGSDAAPKSETSVRPTSTPRSRAINISTSPAHGTASSSQEAPGSADDTSHGVPSDTEEDSHGDVLAAEQPDTSHGGDTEADNSDHGDGPPHWEYTGAAGIVHWADLHEQFTTCVDGAAQSPIDVRQAVDQDLLNLEFDYTPARVGLVNNGHTIQGNFIEGVPGTMTHAGKEYELLQFHFHRPSEHTVNGYQYAMEAHLVHQAEDGSLAVVGILMEPGASNGAFDAIWASLPGEEGATAEIASLFDVEAMLPEVQTTYRYPGSLTTPPCSEGVQWLLMSEPVEVSQADIDTFKNVYFFNARYTQPINGRTIVLDSSAAK